MQIEIKHWSGSVLHTIEADTIKAAVEALVKRGANLRGANLEGAYLRGAYLEGAKYGENIPMSTEPISIIGLGWPILILDQHMKIGCELYSFADWSKFKDSRISKMDISALAWWKIHKAPLMALIAATRPVEKETP